jgi:light-regulated signal transduction histidine kinase (bacteriophytochrome)
VTETFLPVGTQVDLTNCEREPIHIPGSVQPHGVLLSSVGPDGTVLQVSANCADIFGRGPDEVLGTRLADLFHPSSSRVLARAMADPQSERTISPWRVMVPDASGRPVVFDLLTHHWRGVWVLELQPATESPLTENTLTGVRTAVTRLSQAPSVVELLDRAAQVFRQLTGFDRVMVYRFDREWNGHVVAETRRLDLEPFLGLHYPASDIPPQARTLYTTNWLRFIRDVDAVSSPLVPPADPVNQEPLDLSGSALRSVSPIHCQYLRNMGVTASMSVSLIIGGKLAGLIACHHYSGPYVPPASIRATSEFLAHTLSLLLASREPDERNERSRVINEGLVAFAQAASSRESDLDGLLDTAAPELMRMLGATGMAWSLEGHTAVAGDTPPEGDVARIRDWVSGLPSDLMVQTESLPLDAPELADLATQASGVLALRLADGQDVLFFRPEVVHTVNWGGNPHLKSLEVDSDGVPRLSPRGSFALWRETVRGRSEEWEEPEQDAAQQLGAQLMSVLYNRHRTVALVAETLQQSLLPEHLPQAEGWSLAAHSRPASAGVGGDWYDAVPLTDGRMLIAIGDVAGHGLAAASAMAQLRNCLRAYAVEDADPVRLLSRVDRATAALSPDVIATVVVAVLDPATGRVQVASAGHPSPVVRTGGVTRLLEVDSMPPLGVVALGVLGSAEVAATELTLGPGDALLLVSDGMFERREEALDVSLRELVGLVDRTLADTPGTEAALHELLHRAPGTSIDDDVTLLLLRGL